MVTDTAPRRAPFADVAERIIALRPAELFLGSRALVWGLALLVLVVLHPVAPTDSLWHDRWLHDVGRGVDLWGWWDGDWYTRIADQGYGTSQSAPAFLPLYPLLVAGLGRAFGGHFIVAGVVVSVAAGAVAFELLHRLALTRLDSQTSRRALVLLALFPTSIFLQAVYAESLYLLLVVATFLLAERGRFLTASALAGLALLTRPSAVALLPPLLVLAWRSERRRQATASMLVAPLMFVAYPLALWAQFGDPLSWLHAQRSWHRHLSSAGPLGGLYDGVHAALTALAHSALHDFALDVEALAYAAVFLALAVVAWRRFGAAYGLFAALSVAIPLSLPAGRWPLMSMSRFCLVAFPCFFALAGLATTRRRYEVVATVSALLLVASVLRWTLYHWVA